MSRRLRIAFGRRLGFIVMALSVATSCSTGGPILTSASPLASPTPTGSATPTPSPTPTATPGPTATPTPAASPTPTPTPNPDGSTTIVEGSFSLPGGVAAIGSSFVLPAAGTLTFSVDWTSAANDIDIGLATGTCSTTQLSLGLCVFAGLEQSDTLKPEVLTLSLPAGTYTPVIASFTNATETITYKITFAPTAAALRGSPMAPPLASLEPLALVKLTGKLRRP
jgi:hypothetical protein